MPSMRPLSLLAAILASALAESSSSSCWDTMHNSTLAVFSSAPIAFSLDRATASQCQAWCGRVSNCQAWVFVDQLLQCDLHRAAPVNVLPETNGFVFGGCDPSGAVLDLPRLIYAETMVEGAASTPTTQASAISLASSSSGATPEKTHGVPESVCLC